MTGAYNKGKQSTFLVVAISYKKGINPCKECVSTWEKFSSSLKINEIADFQKK